MGQKLWPRQREGPEAVGFSRATRFVSRLVATDFLDWTGPEREGDWRGLAGWRRNSKSYASGKNLRAPQLNGHAGNPILLW